MISDRAPELSKQADAILDSYLDGMRSKRKRNYYLNKVVAELPPKVCGCHFCTVKASSENSEFVLLEGDDQA